MTLTEILVHPFREGRQELVKDYYAYFTSGKIQLMDIGPQTALLAAELRGRHKLAGPDALQLAVALEKGADIVLTNDRKWPVLPGLQIEVLAKPL